ncbi:hypothetical protein PPERSA_11676 [Pseudocohnilembus persalinus]|uniref:CSC1/OSCA1-like cytosolic domain-containing protein n=1 Tax=Pseudocohnilembus persalinus TaxID=266149 RepID=A0A0V0QA23_PSEPJ|nr:hypothetical protein PPERSA_11676 [Pseudocohnilembus persalinus]|eukprot:KRW99075.1 hypothetical protein PPERSA_11676 [Pseudocohnilembus persalinus]
MEVPATLQNNVLFLSLYLPVLKLYLNKEGYNLEGKQFRRLAIQVSNFDNKKVKTTDLKECINNLTSSQVQKVVFFYKIRDHIKNTQKKGQLIIQEKVLERELEESHNIIQKEKIKEKLQELSKKIYHTNQEIFNFEEDLQKDDAEHLQLDKAIVVFKNSKITRDMINTYKLNFTERIIFSAFGGMCCLKKNRLNDRELIISKAPEPMDIIFENMEYSDFFKLIARTIFLIAISLILFGSFQLLSFIMVQEVKSQDQFQESQTIMLFYSILYSLVVAVINLAIRLFIYAGIEIEKRTTYSSYYRSLCWKVTVAQFLNSCILPVWLFIKHQAEFDTQQLLSNIFFLLVANCFVVPTFLLIDPLHIYLWFRKFLVKKFPSKYCQQQANEIFEPPALDIAEKYAAINKTVLSAMFFMPLFPQGAILEFTSIILQYWVCKYLMIKKCGFKHKVSDSFSKSMIRLAQMSPLVFTFGVIFQNYQASGGKKWFTYPIPTIIYNEIQLLDQKIKQYEEDFSYEEGLQLYGIDYDMVNPVPSLNNFDTFNSQIIQEQSLQNSQVQNIRKTIKYKLEQRQQITENEIIRFEQMQTIARNSLLSNNNNYISPKIYEYKNQNQNSQSNFNSSIQNGSKDDNSNLINFSKNDKNSNKFENQQNEFSSIEIDNNNEAVSQTQNILDWNSDINKNK